MRVIILGGGITGLFTAYYLAKKGYDITVIDKKTEVSSTSIYNAGLITPSFAPSPPFGIMTLMSAMFRPRNAVYISPREIVRNPSWFATALRTGITRYEKIIMLLGKDSLRLYEKFFAEEGIDDVDLQRGVVGLYVEEENAKLAAEQLGSKLIEQSEIRMMGFRGFGGGILLEDELSVNPHKLVKAVRGRLDEIGVSIIKCVKSGVKKGLGRIDSVIVDDTIIEGDVFVVAAGSKCNELLSPLGYNPRLLPARGLVMLFESEHPNVIAYPALLEDYGIAVVQHNPHTIRATGFFELNGFEAEFGTGRQEWLIDTLLKHIQKFSGAHLVETGTGYRPCTPDQLPLIGRLPNYSNCFVASGNCRLGVTLAPVTGQLVSSTISGELNAEKDILKLVTPERFLRQKSFRKAGLVWN